MTRQEEKIYKLVGLNKDGEIVMCDDIFKYSDGFKGACGTIFEILTKEKAEENDLDFVNEENGYSKDDVDSYEVGGCLSVYKKLGESDYYYREL